MKIKYVRGVALGMAAVVGLVTLEEATEPSAGPANPHPLHEDYAQLLAPDSFV